MTGNIYGRPTGQGGRPPLIDIEAHRRRRDIQLTLGIVGFFTLVGICCGAVLCGVATHLIHW